MQARQSDKECWVSANWIATKAGLNRGAVHYWAVKMRLRYFKFGGVRYLERNNAQCLLDNLVKRKSYKNIDTTILG